MRNNLIKAGPRAEENSQWKIKMFLLSLSLQSFPSWSSADDLGLGVRVLASNDGGKNSARKASSSHVPKFSAPLMWPPSNS